MKLTWESLNLNLVIIFCFPCSTNAFVARIFTDVGGDR